MRKALYILGELKEEDILFLARAGDRRQLSDGDTLITAGMEVSSLYFVTDGHLTAVLPAGLTVAKLSVGDVVGEMSLIEDRPPEVSVISDGGTTLLAVPQDAIKRQLGEDPLFASRFYKAMAGFLSDRLRATTNKLAGADEVGEELGESFLDNVHVAGDRMLRLIRLMDGSKD